MRNRWKKDIFHIQENNEDPNGIEQKDRCLFVDRNVSMDSRLLKLPGLLLNQLMFIITQLNDLALIQQLQ